MIQKVSVAIVLAAMLTALIAPRAAAAEPAPRRLTFADLAAMAVQNNLSLRAAAIDVAVARAQLAQAQGARTPQAGLSGAYTRTQEMPPLDPNNMAQPNSDTEFFRKVLLNDSLWEKLISS